MRQRFAHVIPPREPELDEIWNGGIVTVDANVLLDLYRLHGPAREELLQALERYRGRLWLTHQAAAEFLRNRSAVVAGVWKEFDAAEAALTALEKDVRAAINKLNNQRPIPGSTASGLAGGVDREIATARSAVCEARQAHRSYLENDPILEKVLWLFDGAIGPEPSAEDRATLEKEAERRRGKKIPPGYLDESKGGDLANGDYFLWAQVLEHATVEGRPIILVTSERKDDWWERHHGKTYGPRRELVEEAARMSNQRVLIYRTDAFLEHAARRQGVTLAASTIAELRSVGKDRHSPSRVSSRQAEDALESTLDSLARSLVDSDDQVTSLIAETNASGFDVDSVEIVEIGDFNFADASFPFQAIIHFSGEQHEDRMFCGTAITAEITGVACFDGTEWEISDYEVVAGIDEWGDEPDDEDDDEPDDEDDDEQ